MITGWGVAFPQREVTNQELTTLFDTSDEWIVSRSGIHSRRVATGPFVDPQPPKHPEGGMGTTATLAVTAARRALSVAGLEGPQIDTLILCTTTPDQLIPGTSAAVSEALGIRRGAFDVNAACAGFTYGLVTAAGLIAMGTERVLLVGAETLSRATNWADRTNAFLWGDGAGAVVIEAQAGESCLLGWDLGADGSLVPIVYADHGQGIVMHGQEVFRRAVLATVESASAAMEMAKVTADDISLVVLHQANIRIMHAVVDRLGIPQDRMASVIEWTGNTSSASIPIALADAATAGRLEEGDLVLLAGFGAGMTWASAVLRWGS